MFTLFSFLPALLSVIPASARHHGREFERAEYIYTLVTRRQVQLCAKRLYKAVQEPSGTYPNFYCPHFGVDRHLVYREVW